MRARLGVKTLRHYVVRRLRLGRYLRAPGDGRPRPVIPASTLVWGFLVAQVLRFHSFVAVERLARSRARRAASLERGFGDDALAYFTERLDPARTRQALVASIRGAKRNKAFDSSRFIGLAVDSTGVSRCRLPSAQCDLCRPVKNADGQIVSYVHAFSMIAVVAGGLCLPVDVEPYGPGETEDAASQRLVRRTIAQLGSRFADYLVADAKYATAPFCHLAEELGVRVVIRLKDNLPTLLSQAQWRFHLCPPAATFEEGSDRVEIWDADDFHPWAGLRWGAVRVIRYRQRKSDGAVVEAFWLTNFPASRVGPRSLYHLAKSRWKIENQGFNDAKNRYGLEHIRHHHKNSMLVVWLLILLAMTIERLFRLRFLHRGSHPVRSAVDLHFRLLLSLGYLPPRDTS